jgi:low affinity Fe/Cu permease
VHLSESKQVAVYGVRYRLTRLGVLAAHPAAFLVVFVFVGLWLIFDRPSFGWAGVATVSTLFMTLLIQRAEHRDTQAIHAKLDELLRVNRDARSELTRLDEQEPELIERHRANARAHDGS